MNITTNQNPAPAVDVIEAEARWEGHMADDVGSTYGHTPMAFLAVRRDTLLLSGNRGTFRFAREEVTRVGRGGFYPWFFGAVRIHHRVLRFPAELQFKPLGAKPAEVIARLRELGYPVR
jgi:hypothetical protein